MAKKCRMRNVVYIILLMCIQYMISNVGEMLNLFHVQISSSLAHSTVYTSPPAHYFSMSVSPDDGFIL